MEKYTVNGIEFEYDTFDLDNMEAFAREVEEMRDRVESIYPEGAGMTDQVRILREQGEHILDFFDTVVGEGTAEKLFGRRMNIRDLLEGYKSFTAAVAKVQGTLGGENREQRRDRQKRRQPA